MTDISFAKAPEATVVKVNFKVSTNPAFREAWIKC